MNELQSLLFLMSILGAKLFIMTTDERSFFSPETIDKLTEGFLNILQPEVLRVEQSLDELT